MQITSLKKQYDIVVVGGGLVGASFACAMDQALANCAGLRPISILVVEAFQQSDQSPQAQPSFDARTTALSHGSRKIFESIGLWQQLQDRVTPIHEIQVSDKGRFGSTKLNSQTEAVPALGYVIDNSHLGWGLNRAMQTSQVIELICPATINKISPNPQGMMLTITPDSSDEAAMQIQAALVVLADGGRSPICAQLGITHDVKDYGQQAIISNIAFQIPHRNIAFERFTDTGPLAVLPIAGQNNENRGALVWTVERDAAESILAQSETKKLHDLQLKFGHRLGNITRIGKCFSYPLSLSVAKEQIRPGLVLLGNVAHTLHPVAGQGLNLALRDVQCLVESLLKGIAENDYYASTRLAQQGEFKCSGDETSLGSMGLLQQYQDRQQWDQDKTIGFSHYTTRLFSSNNTALVWARKFGLFSIDLIPSFKRSFARQAMGIVPK
ncbi:MAG: 2-octaprenyl-6-methoxyphenyl hydroxylase [SAR86 cluster bacterium]|uniref:2-octaprenyl-6-methoxyphenyl hydroxylase n=1 Tax=SAR86 cluster bacterium TaxID=2030880 RepID=A0A2A4MSY1_9GAMM|nr:MAG: 2-octaprenyl-6-methoxyphenyl hydroxylase [SAR86 cluster bacterium]